MRECLIVFLGLLTIGTDSPYLSWWLTWPPPCQHKSGWVPTKSQLFAAAGVRQHIGPSLIVRMPNGVPPPLCKAKLSGQDLSSGFLRGADLSDADLRHADLSDAHLAGAHLYSARLENADLSDADLRGADLFGAHLRGADLSDADLTKARLEYADLSDATLENANLTDADMSNVRVGGAKFAGASLERAVYGPTIDKTPDPNVQGITGLAELRIPPGEQQGIVQLRKLTQDAGLRDEERQTTDTIERSVTATEVFRIGPWQWYTPEGLLRLVAFDWTTSYGLHPFHALALIAYIWAAFALIYVWPIWKTSHKLGDQKAGIYRISPADRVIEDRARPTIVKDPAVNRIEEASFLKALRSAAWFSLLSAFNIGFEAFNVGDWISRLQPHEYSIKAMGWIRIVSGAQSLLSLGLLAIAVLTYFGRPFQ